MLTVEDRLTHRLGVICDTYDVDVQILFVRNEAAFLDAAAAKLSEEAARIRAVLRPPTD